jgi:hypothetical protein
MLLLLHRWFDKSEDDGLIERELLPGAAIVGGTHWRLTVATGEAKLLHAPVS